MPEKIAHYPPPPQKTNGPSQTKLTLGPLWPPADLTVGQFPHLFFCFEVKAWKETLVDNGCGLLGLDWLLAVSNSRSEELGLVYYNK